MIVLLLISNLFFPQNNFVLEKEGFVVSYDGRTKNAIWVFETLAECPKKQRSDYHFKADAALPEPIRAKLSDYLGSGYHRGHLCPYKDVQNASTFLLSNISPQLPGFNLGLWKRLEEYIRSLAKRFDTVHVITLPLFLADPATKRVGYEVLGERRVGVPTHFCKVAYAIKGSVVEIHAFIIPHQVLPKETPLTIYRSNLDEIERLSGVIFYRPRSELSK